jgi:glutaminyl-peptide cyclotransferase
MTSMVFVDQFVPKWFAVALLNVLTPAIGAWNGNAFIAPREYGHVCTVCIPREPTLLRPFRLFPYAMNFIPDFTLPPRPGCVRPNWSSAVFRVPRMKRRVARSQQSRRPRSKPLTACVVTPRVVALTVLAVAASIAAAVTWSISSSTAVSRLLREASDAEPRHLHNSGTAGAVAGMAPLREKSTGPSVRRARIVAEYPHGLDAFTQGLSWYRGDLIESTGLYGKSCVRRIELPSGRVLAQTDLPTSEFGEGSAVVGDELLQVSWKTGNGYIYSLPDLALLSTFTFQGDGWGLASDPTDPELLYLSDGSDTIRVMRLQRETENGRHNTLVEVRSFVVTNGAGGLRVALLNELEMVGSDELWANIWMSDLVARIDVITGVVLGWVDMRGLLAAEVIPSGHQADVLNGIVQDRGSGRLYVTGKFWPRLFEIEVPETVTASSIRFLNPFFTDPRKVKRIMASTL